MSEHKNSGSESDTDHIDHLLEETRIKVLGQEAVKQAGEITKYSGETGPQMFVEEVDKLTYLAGVIEPAETVRDAQAITAYETEVIATGEDLPEDEELEEDASEEASQILQHDESTYEVEDPLDAHANAAYEAEMKAAEARAKETNKKLQSQIDQGTDENV